MVGISSAALEAWDKAPATLSTSEMALKVIASCFLLGLFLKFLLILAFPKVSSFGTQDGISFALQ